MVQENIKAFLEIKKAIYNYLSKIVKIFRLKIKFHKK